MIINFVLRKKVNYQYSVICSASGKYEENNTFSLVPIYSVFGSSRCQESRPVEISTDTVDLNMGGSATLSADGRLSRANPGRGGWGLTIINEYGNMHFDVSQLITSIDGSQGMQPIYVSPSYGTGNISMRPDDVIMVWFEKGVSSGIVFSDSKSGVFEVDLRDRDSAEIEYVNGYWKSV